MFLEYYLYNLYVKKCFIVKLNSDRFINFPSSQLPSGISSLCSSYPVLPSSSSLESSISNYSRSSSISVYSSKCSSSFFSSFGQGSKSSFENSLSSKSSSISYSLLPSSSSSITTSNVHFHIYSHMYKVYQEISYDLS